MVGEPTAQIAFEAREKDVTRHQDVGHGAVRTSSAQRRVCDLKEPAQRLILVIRRFRSDASCQAIGTRT